MRRPSVITIVGLPLIGLVLLPAVTNIATGALPEKWQPYQWVAWPLAALLAIPVVVAEVRSRRRTSDSGIGTRQETATPDGVIWNIPPKMATFTGRKAELRAIDRAATRQPNGAAVLCGLPGVGKTQVAAAYAAVHRGAFDLGWWVVADSRLAVVTSLAQLADLLGIGGEDQEAAARAAVRTLGGQSRWLLVFDNVTGEQDIADLIPSGDGRVLVTSRDPGLARLGTVVQIEPFDEKAATRFLLDRTGSAQADAATTLANELGGLPLALEQAAAYCISSGIGLADYLERYRSDRGRLMRQGAPAGRLAVQATVALAVREAGRRDPAAVQLLRLCAFFAGPAGIPRWLLTADRRRLPMPLRRAAADLIRFDAAVAVLVRLALVKAEGDLLRVHPLVQDLLVDQIGRTGPVRRRWRTVAGQRPGGDRTAGWDHTRWVRLAAELANAALSGDPGNPDGWERWTSMTPHVSRLLEHAAASEMFSETTARLRNQTGWYLWHRGEYANARLMLEQAYQEAKRAFGNEHPDTLGTMNNLAEVLRAQGDLDAAHHLHQQTLDITRRVLGDEHPHTLASMNNLARVLDDLGRHEEAERLRAEARRGRAAVPDPDGDGDHDGGRADDGESAQA